jgi:hypothetical protein
MGGDGRGELPQDLQRALRRLETWRRGRRAGRRIPETLWALAVRLVGRHGVSRTATALGLDYYSLRERAERGTESAAAVDSAFVELPAPVAGGKQCVIEWDHGDGATLRVQLAGYDAADIATLTRGFRDAD